MVGKECSQNHIPTSFASPCTLRCPTSRLTPHLWTPAQQDGVFTLQSSKQLIAVLMFVNALAVRSKPSAAKLSTLSNLHRSPTGCSTLGTEIKATTLHVFVNKCNPKDHKI